MRPSVRPAADWLAGQKYAKPEPEFRRAWSVDNQSRHTQSLAAADRPMVAHRVAFLALAGAAAAEPATNSSHAHRQLQAMRCETRPAPPAFSRALADGALALALVCDGTGTTQPEMMSLMSAVNLECCDEPGEDCS